MNDTTNPLAESMVDEETQPTVPQPIESAFVPPSIPDIPALYDRLLTLRTHEAAIVREIRIIKSQLGLPDDTAKEMWHCLRCGHDWLGSATPPAQCARCHSAGWATPPTLAHHRRPEDPINPQWYRSSKRRRGRPRYKRPDVTARNRASKGLRALDSPPSMAGPSQLPPLHLPRLRTDSDYGALVLPPLPAPTTPLLVTVMPHSLRPLAERLRQLAEEPPQPESIASTVDRYLHNTAEGMVNQLAHDLRPIFEELPDEVSPVQTINEVHNVPDAHEPIHPRVEERPTDPRNDSTSALADDLPDDSRIDEQ